MSYIDRNYAKKKKLLHFYRAIIVHLVEACDVT